MRPHPLITASLMLAFSTLLLNLRTEKASAQDIYHGRISGTVTDPTGHIIPGADVSIINESTGIAVSLKTDNDGFYVADKLVAGTYSVKVTKDQFEVTITKGNAVRARERWTEDVLLVPGAKTETITVQADTWVPGVGRMHIIGIQNRKITDSSPSASSSLSPALSAAKAGSPVKVHFIVENISDHEIEYFAPLITFDVRDENGKLAPDTPLGCTRHFFSPCYSVSDYNGSQVTSPPIPRLVPHEKSEGDQDLTVEYDLTRAGTYTVVGYVCSFIDYGLGCFRSNTIKITVR